MRSDHLQKHMKTHNDDKASDPDSSDGEGPSMGSMEQTASAQGTHGSGNIGVTKTERI